MLDDFVIGPVRFRIDFLLIPVGIAVATKIPIGVGFLIAILVHELGHAIAKKIVEGDFVLYLQVGGGGPYVRSVRDRKHFVFVLLAGPLLTLVPALAGHLYVQYAPTGLYAFWGASLRFACLVWAGFQLLPFPTLDTGLILRRWITKKTDSATLAWKVGWVLGFTIIILVVTLSFDLFPWAVWLTVVAILLGRAEAAYVRHVDAFSAWERGDHKGVIAYVTALPEKTKPADAIGLLELGLASAIHLEDVAMIEKLAGRFPSHHPSALGASEWLLIRERPYGAKLAEAALEELDHERVKQADVDLERYADMTFRFAIFQAAEMRWDSALGLLERAVVFGFDDVDRMEAEGRFDRIRDRSRFQALIGRLRS